MANELQIDGDRLWKSLMDMAQIGATDKGGVCRLALTDVDKAARDLFVQWCEEAGCVVTVDRMGNIFGRREGKNPDLPPVMTGSHIDSQPTGGKFDGILGVLAGLEVIRTLNDAGAETEAAVEVSAWTNEEGSRFAPAMVSSGVFAGVFSLDYGLSRADLDGKTMGEELERIGYAGELPVGKPVKAFFELHIEQGPILEHENKTIGVVTDAQGQRWYECTFVGQEAHAGPTPMATRRDAMVGAARVIEAVNRIGLENAPLACATVGLVEVFPNSRNTIPGRVFFAIDLRHPNDETLSKMDQEIRAVVAKVGEGIGLETKFEEIWYSPPVPFDADCVAAVRRAATELGFPHRDIVSGAGHDACYISRVAPTSMVFIPCEGGISHNEVEMTQPEQVTAGCQVLLQAMVERANAS